MRQYLDLLARVLEQGEPKGDRTGTGTRSLFGPQLRFDLAQGFPLLTTKKLHVRSIIAELLWFLKGDTNVQGLREMGCSIWDEWADKETGDLGPVYGKQWRRWQSADGSAIDQISQVMELIRHHPDSRRMLVSAWNVGEVDQMALPPCHCLFQFYVSGNRLSCHLYQRSADVFLGVPFNIASYALLTQMLAQVTGRDLGELIISFGDVHLYNNHVQQAREQLSRAPRPLPTMQLNPHVESVFNFTLSDFELIGYDPQPHIAAPVSV